MIKEIDKLRLLQLVLIVAFLLIFMFAEWGTYDFNLTIYYFRESTGGNPDGLSLDISPNFGQKLCVLAMCLLEVVFVLTNKKATAVISNVLSFIRVLFTVLPFLVFYIQQLDTPGDFTRVTLFSPLALLLGIASFVIHILLRKRIIKENVGVNEDTERGKSIAP